MKTIKIGESYYNWSVEQYNWLAYTEIHIVNVVDDAEQLSIGIPSVSKNTKINPLLVRDCILFALQQAWTGQKVAYELALPIEKAMFSPLAFSCAAEQIVIKKLALKHQKKIALLAKSELKYQLDNLQKQLGFSLPRTLKQLYLNLGNSHNNSAFGLLKLYKEEGDKEATIIDLYKSLHTGYIKAWQWEFPRHFLPIMDWETGVYTLLDCQSIEGAVWVLDENLKTANNHWQNCLWKHCDSLTEWLKKWLESERYSSRAIWLEMYRTKGLI